MESLTIMEVPGREAFSKVRYRCNEIERSNVRKERFHVGLTGILLFVV